jgi:hypothetical protein
VSLKIRLGIKEVWDASTSALITIITFCGALYISCRWEVETDEVVLKQRQNQTDYGKRTQGYQYFLQQVPK